MKYPAPQLPCPVYRKCNGCQLQNLTYPEQIKWKQRKIGQLFGSLCAPKPLLSMEEPYYYRNKVQSVFRRTKKKS